jgi:hypothetical protein
MSSIRQEPNWSRRTPELNAEYDRLRQNTIVNKNVGAGDSEEAVGGFDRAVGSFVRASVLIGSVTSLVFVPMVVWRAYVLASLWRWFVEPVHVGATAFPHVTTAQFAGVFLILKAILPQKESEGQKDTKKFFKDLMTHGFLLPLISLIAGYAIWRIF